MQCTVDITTVITNKAKARFQEIWTASLKKERNSPSSERISSAQGDHVESLGCPPKFLSRDQKDQWGCVYVLISQLFFWCFINIFGEGKYIFSNSPELHHTKFSCTAEKFLIKIRLCTVSICQIKVFNLSIELSKCSLIIKTDFLEVYYKIDLSLRSTEATTPSDS